jgi:hypothetical protein
MSVLAIEFNDASLTGVVGGELRFAEPGYAVAPDGNLMLGRAARSVARRYPRYLQNRYWSELSENDLPAPVAGAVTAADLAHAQLAELWQMGGSDCDAAIFAVPANWSGEQLGLLLGMAQEEGVPVAGFVDAAVAATRREYPGRSLFAVEAYLHATDVAQLNQDGQVSIGERQWLPDLGVERLERVAMAYMAGCFVAQARFDPLHDAESEQALYDQLDQRLEQLSREAAVDADLTTRAGGFQARLEQTGLAERITEACQPLLQRLRALLPAGRAAAIQVGPRLGAFPGVVPALAALPDTAVFVLEPGAVSRGAVRAAGRPDGGAIRLVSRLSWDQPAAPDSVSSQAADAIRPTHLLDGNRAYRLADHALSIGTTLAPGDFGIAIDSAIAGVSRRHCSVEKDAGRIILRDHSRYGTRLNGHLIDGSAVLQAGDVIAIGNPSREFRVVLEVDADGA